MRRLASSRLIAALLSASFLFSPTAALGQTMVRVCARPPDVPPNTGRWAYGAGEGRGEGQSEGDQRERPAVKKLDEPQWNKDHDCGQVLPCEKMQRGDGPVIASGKGNGTSDGDGEGDGPKKDAADNAAEQLALAAGLANLDVGEDIHRKDGKQHGIVGGSNPSGIDHVAAQAAVAALILGMAVLTAPGKAFVKRLETAIQKKQPLILKEAAELTEETAEELAKHYGAQIADALAHNGAIGPYRLWKKFTSGLGSQYQAHHILEKAMARDLQLAKNFDDLPSVILTDAQHKKITAALREKKPTINGVQDLWDTYQKVYKDHPHWLEAIKPYFKK
jgi:hypothetical protein